MIDPSIWFMFPVGIAVATVAMLAGIGGALMFSPLFMLLGLDPLTAIGAGLLTEVFGFSSGVFGYWRKRDIDWQIVIRLIGITIPFTIAGVWLGRQLPAQLLQIALIGLLIFLSFKLLRRERVCITKHPKKTGSAKVPYLARLPEETYGLAAIGALLLGMISAGLGEVNEYNFLKKLKLKVPIASGTSVFLVAMSAIVGVAAHGWFFINEASWDTFARALSIIVFTVPGVIIGAQLGVYFSQKINAKRMSLFVGVLFFVLAGLTVLTL